MGDVLRCPQLDGAQIRVWVKVGKAEYPDVPPLLQGSQVIPKGKLRNGISAHQKQPGNLVPFQVCVQSGIGIARHDQFLHGFSTSHTAW